MVTEDGLRELLYRQVNQNRQRHHPVAINQSIIAPEFTSPDDFILRHSVVKIKLTPMGG